MSQFCSFLSSGSLSLVWCYNRCFLSPPDTGWHSHLYIVLTLDFSWTWNINVRYFSSGWTQTNQWTSRLACPPPSRCCGSWWSSTSPTPASWRRSTPDTSSPCRSSETWPPDTSSATTTQQLSWLPTLSRVRKGLEMSETASHCFSNKI